MAEPKILENNERGQTRVEGNAFIQGSHIQDAAEVRVGSPSGPGSGGGGKFSFDVTPEGPAGPKREIASMMAGEGVNGAEWKLVLLKKGGQTTDADQITVIEATAAGIEFKVPIKGFASGLRPGMKIALRSLANGRLVCAEAGGNQPLQANRDVVGPWETFEVIEV